MDICVLKTLFFVHAFLKFSDHNLSLLLIFFYFFIFNNVLTTVNTTDIYNFTKNRWISNPFFSVQYFAFPPSSTFCLNLIIPNITPGGLFSGVLIHGRSFLFQKLVPKRPRAYTRWGLLSEFTVVGMFTTYCAPGGNILRLLS